VNPLSSYSHIPPPVAELGDCAPQAEFGHLETLWFQVTGTICNLRCSHCFISCSPDNHTLELMSRAQVDGYLAEAGEIGVKEIYFTGGEPFLHPEIFEILAAALAVAPTTVLTNGVLISERFAQRLGELAAASAYSLEIRVSLDAPEEEANDAIRGAGVFAKALRPCSLYHPSCTTCLLTGMTCRNF
jgi:MoaA/NifB/PqqE/SkfB family radical SAM enzyme